MEEPGPAPTPARLGPLVRRSVHHGALLWFAAALGFVVAMGLVGYAWTTPYSLSSNAISDLGNTACGPWPDAGSHYVCSPWNVVFNGAAIAFGALVVLGALLVRSAFPARKSSTIGLGLLVLSGVGSIGVGAIPENVYANGHLVFAVLSLGVGAAALLVLALAMLRDTRWGGYRAYTLLSGAVSVIAFLLLAAHRPLGLGFGGMERLVAGPELLWLLLASIHLLFIPAYAPKAIATG